MTDGFAMPFDMPMPLPPEVMAAAQVVANLPTFMSALVDLIEYVSEEGDQEGFYRYIQTHLCEDHKDLLTKEETFITLRMLKEKASNYLTATGGGHHHHEETENGNG
jgi:hypothetical protein